jgi:exonuclease SbcD
MFPNAVDVVLEGPTAERASSPDVDRRSDRSPRELFDAYLTNEGVDEPALLALFDELYEEAVA